MQEISNTLYVTTEHSYLHLDHDTIRLEVEHETQFRMPLIHLSCIMCFGNILLSPALIHRCAEDGRSIVLMDGIGRFKARIEGPVQGNVLLRRAQHEALSDMERTIEIARSCVAGKIQNSRQVVLRAARESDSENDRTYLERTSSALASSLSQLENMDDLDAIRGCEGDAARNYFSSFTYMIREDREAFAFTERNRRPPLDRTNALLSFLYGLVRADCSSALEGVGLDPQVGYLHTLRSGRPALALDMMEEMRAIFADRLVLTLINRQQIRRDDFEIHPGGEMTITPKGKKEILTAYQKRKQDEVHHKIVNRKITIGLIPHVQARLLARHLRGDLPDYLPFLYR